MTSPGRDKPIEILLLEGDAVETELINKALTESHIFYRLTVLADSEAALAFLQRRGPYEEAARPDLILVDLDLPHNGGHAVLAAITGDPVLRVVRVLVLSSVPDAADILRKYGLPATAYIVKSNEGDPYLHVIKVLEDFWESLEELLEGEGFLPEENGEDSNGHNGRTPRGVSRKGP